MSGQQNYPTAYRVLRAEVGGTPIRKRVLATVAAYLDEGHEPSLREIAQRSGVTAPKLVKRLIERCERDGLVRVEWVPRGASCLPNGKMPRNRYEVLI